MTDAALLVQLVLAAGFLWAGCAKLLPGADTEKAVRNFGVPPRVARPVAVLLPVTEIATGLALVFADTARVGAAAACVLLVAFLVGIAVNLALGRTPECKCFGERHTKPVGWRTVARDVVLLAGAGFVFWRESSDPGAGPLARLGEIAALPQLSLDQALLIACGALLASILVSVWLLVPQFLRQQGRILLRLDEVERRLADDWPLDDTGLHLNTNGSSPAGLPVGSPFPGFDLLGPAGQEVTLEGLRGRRFLLVNWNPICPFCEQIAEDLSELDPRLADHGVDLLLVNHGPAHDEHLWRSSAPLAPFAGVGTPAAYLIDEHGRVAAPLEVGAGNVLSLVARLPVGSIASDLTLTDTHGGELSLGEFIGRPVLLIFTDPQCAACAELLASVRALASDLGDTDLVILFIGTDDGDGNRRYADEQALPFPLLVDRDMALAGTYGIVARPSALLLDSTGAVLEGVTEGADGIKELIARDGDPVDSRR